MLLGKVQAFMLQRCQPGSDARLCVARAVPVAVSELGRRAQRELVTQQEARSLASECGMSLRGLGGDERGVLGALRPVRLAASGNDGRYVLVGRSRELAGLQPTSALLAAGIAAVQTRIGEPVTEGPVQTDRLCPALLYVQPIAVVEWATDHWRARLGSIEH